MEGRFTALPSAFLGLLFCYRIILALLGPCFLINVDYTVNLGTFSFIHEVEFNMVMISSLYELHLISCGSNGDGSDSGAFFKLTCLSTTILIISSIIHSLFSVCMLLIGNAYPWKCIYFQNYKTKQGNSIHFKWLEEVVGENQVWLCFKPRHVALITARAEFGSGGRMRLKQIAVTLQ